MRWVIESVATLASHITAEEGMRSPGLVRIGLEKPVTSFAVFVQCEKRLEFTCHHFSAFWIGSSTDSTCHTCSSRPCVCVCVALQLEGCLPCQPCSGLCPLWYGKGQFSSGARHFLPHLDLETCWDMSVRAGDMAAIF